MAPEVGVGGGNLVRLLTCGIGRYLQVGSIRMESNCRTPSWCQRIAWLCKTNTHCILRAESKEAKILGGRKKKQVSGGSEGRTNIFYHKIFLSWISYEHIHEFETETQSPNLDVRWQLGDVLSSHTQTHILIWVQNKWPPSLTIRKRKSGLKCWVTSSCLNFNTTLLDYLNLSSKTISLLEWVSSLMHPSVINFRQEYLITGWRMDVK